MAKQDTVIMKARQMGNNSIMRQAFLHSMKGLTLGELYGAKLGVQHRLDKARAGAIYRTTEMWCLEQQLEMIELEIKSRQLTVWQSAKVAALLASGWLLAWFGIGIGKLNWSGKKNVRWWLSGAFCNATNWLANRAARIQPKEQTNDETKN